MNIAIIESDTDDTYLVVVRKGDFVERFTIDNRDKDKLIEKLSEVIEDNL